MRKVTLAGLAAAVMTGVVAAAATMFFGPGPAGAIVNGRNAEPGQFSFPVKLTMTNVPRSDGTTYGSACSAALISPQWIVIAGHCFHDVNRNPVSGRPRYKTTATIGVANLGDSHAITVAVVNVRQAGVNDIALAKLAEPVTGVSTLAIADRAPAAGQELTIAGWGATGSVDPTPSTQLRYGKVAVSSVTSTRCWCTASGRRPTPAPAPTTPVRHTSPATRWSRWRAPVRTARTPATKRPPASTSSRTGSPTNSREAEPYGVTTPIDVRVRLWGGVVDGTDLGDAFAVAFVPCGQQGDEFAVAAQACFPGRSASRRVTTPLGESTRRQPILASGG